MEDEVQKLSKASKINYLKIISFGKRFESYIGWIFSKELNCKNYCLNLKYSLLYEKKRLIDIMKMKKIENHQAKMMEKKIDDYIREQMAQIQSKFKNATDTTTSTTTTTESDESTEVNKIKDNLISIKNDKNSINIEANKKLETESNQINKKKINTKKMMMI